MEKKTYKRWLDVKRVTGQYEKDGKTRNRYLTIGSVVSTPHHTHQFLVLDAVPNAGERLALFVNDGWSDTDTTETTEKPKSSWDTAKERFKSSSVYQGDDEFKVDEIPF